MRCWLSSEAIPNRPARTNLCLIVIVDDYVRDYENRGCEVGEWGMLVPWLILGQGTQVGKSAVKGAGVYPIIDPPPGYWSWL